MAHARTNWTSARVEWRVTSPKAHLDVRRVHTRKPATPGRRVAESAVAVHDGWMMGEAPLRDFLHQTGHSARVVHGATALELATELRRDHFGAGGGGGRRAGDAERDRAALAHQGGRVEETMATSCSRAPPTAAPCTATTRTGTLGGEYGPPVPPTRAARRRPRPQARRAPARARTRHEVTGGLVGVDEASEVRARVFRAGATGGESPGHARRYRRRARRGRAAAGRRPPPKPPRRAGRAAQQHVRVHPRAHPTTGRARGRAVR